MNTPLHLGSLLIGSMAQNQDVARLNEAIEAVLDCATACDACAMACLGEAEPQRLRDCIRACLDCADVCHTTARVLSRVPQSDSRVLGELVELCRLAATTCAEICERHAGHHDHCRLSGEACRKCDVACAAFLGEAR